MAVLSVFTQFCFSGQLTSQSFYCTVHCACFVLICRELKCLFSVLWCLLVSCETNCSAFHSGHYESQMELHGFGRTLNFLAPLPPCAPCRLKLPLSFSVNSPPVLLFPSLLWPGSNPGWSGGSGVDTLGDIWPQQCSFNHVLARDARLIRLSDRAEQLSEESSVH